MTTTTVATLAGMFGQEMRTYSILGIILEEEVREIAEIDG